VVVHAASARGAVELPVTVAPPPRQEARGVLGTLWARARIGELEGHLASGRAEAAREITSLGVSFQLATRFTSFVAVDRSRRAGDGAPPTISVPVDAPEGTFFDRDGAEQSRELEKRPAPEPSADPGDEPTATVTEARAPPSADRGPRGCGCRVGPTPPEYGAWLLAAALLAAARRHRRRQKPEY
jgi:Ca-activated chloride channel family protein